MGRFSLAGQKLTLRRALVASASGQSRHFGRRPTISGLPLETDIVRVGRHVSKVPTEVADFSIPSYNTQSFLGIYYARP
jgi:hypothetical protein